MPSSIAARKPASRLAAEGLAALWLAATPASAQTLVGRVLEEGRDDRPVPEATVALVDREGNRRAQATADSLGRYRLAPPGAGEYVVEARRIGYEPTRSPLLALSEEGTAPFDLVLRPDPVGLQGFEVTVEEPPDEVVKRLLGPMGLDPEMLGERWIDREEIERMAPRVSTNDDLIRWRAIPRAWVEPPRNSALKHPLCVRWRKGGGEGCALVVYNGAPIDPLVANQMPADAFEAIAVLTPEEATTLYGSRGGLGAVVIWVRGR